MAWVKKRYALLIVVCSVLVWMYASVSTYTVIPYKECLSPSKQYAATFYYAGGGGAAGWTATALSVWDTEYGFNPDKRIIESFDNEELDFQWLGENHLLVLQTTPPDKPEMAIVVKGKNITVSFQKIQSTQDSSQPKDSYGCNGVALTSFKKAEWRLFYWRNVDHN